jgi:hypothetical protein
MTTPVPATTFLLMDEPCYWVRETVRKSPDHRSWRRYRSVGVTRDDRIAEHLEDMGPSQNYPIEEFQFIGFGVERVGDLISASDNYHRQLQECTAIPEELIHSVDLVAAYVDHIDNRKKSRKARSTFGPGGTMVRE